MTQVRQPKNFLSRTKECLSAFWRESVPSSSLLWQQWREQEPRRCRLEFPTMRPWGCLRETGSMPLKSTRNGFSRILNGQETGPSSKETFQSGTRRIRFGLTQVKKKTLFSPFGITLLLVKVGVHMMCLTPHKEILCLFWRN